jgi:hypothetical protein
MFCHPSRDYFVRDMRQIESMTQSRPTVLLLFTALLAACADDIAPRTVTEFMDDPLLLEAVLLRCTENRTESRYEAECVNAREAVKLIEAKEVADRRAELEVMSERKREALRRTQQAAAMARRRAAEAEKLREEMEYQAQFGLPMPASGSGSGDAMQGNEPVAVVSAPPAAPTSNTDASNSGAQATLPAAGSNAPLMQAEAPPAESADLGAIRQEMRRRREDEGGGSP